MRFLGGAVALVAAALLAAVALGGLGSTGTSERGGPVAVPLGDAVTGSSGTAATVAGQPVPRERRVPPGPGAPRRLVVPALGVDAPVVAVGLRGSVLVPPSDPTTLGWWAGGARPGAARGSALIAGHTVHTGGGALDHLGDLRRGDLVRLRLPSGWLRYRVDSVRDLAKAAIAARAQQLFSQHVAGRLVLLTCTDWDGTGYRSNTVVTAHPL